MSEISNIPPSPSQPRTALREPQPIAGGAQLGQVEEEAGADDANTPAAFQRAALGILGRPYVSDRTNLPNFGQKGSLPLSHFLSDCPANLSSR